MNPKGSFFPSLRGEKWNLQPQVSTSEKSIYLVDYEDKNLPFSVVIFNSYWMELKSTKSGGKILLFV